MAWHAYYRLMRLDKPIGILLLWYPTAWGLWIANKGMPAFKLILLFFIGTVLMRSAGCVINDMADRHIDKYVTRTKLRPLTSDEITLKEAFIVLALLLTGALFVVLNLPIQCFIWAVFSLLIAIIYPFCKRYINAPQMVLGFAFSMGIPMAYVASGKALDESTLVLIIINFLWIVAYDTMYAMVDKEDDLKVGVKSTAIYFAQYDRIIIGFLQVSLHFSWLLLAHYLSLEPIFYAFWILAACILLYQQKLIYKRTPNACFHSFLMSSYYGAFMWLALI